MRVRTLLHGLCSIVLLALSPAVEAQVFIPSTVERDWLNAEIPGIVDAAGIMDTLHPGIVNVDSVQLTIAPGAGAIEALGFQYLDSLSYLTINSFIELTIPRFPESLDVFVLYVLESSTTLGRLPRMMGSLAFSSVLGSGGVQIESMPDTIHELSLSNLGSFTWEPGGFAQNVNISWSMGQTVALTLPAIDIGELNLSSMTVTEMDLSAATVDRLNLGFVQIDGPILWPSDVTSMNVDASFNSPFLTWPTTLTDLNIGLADFYVPLPAWPTGLTDLYIQNASDLCLPAFPDALSSFWMHNLPDCIPNWPASLAFISGLEPLYPNTANYCSVLNSDCPGGNPGIAGRVFVDVDSDGQYDPDEPGLQQTQVVLQPAGQVTGCGPDGSWQIGVLPGTYTITAGSGYPYIQSISPAMHSASLSEMGDTDLMNDFAVTLIPDIQDLRVSLHADPARPGFDNRLYLTCQNYGTTVVDAELTLSYDDDQTWVGSSTSPSSTTGNTATWSFPAMDIGTSSTITVDLNTATSVALGTAILHVLSADPIATDETPLNNTTHFADSVVGSYDPNDKLLQPALLSPSQVQAEEKAIEYTIRFQNTGTYAAERVVILDTLSEDLQWASMQFIASSHPCHWYITDGVLHVIHNDILLPDSTSDEANSHGFVKFSMLPANDLQNGAEITNIAHIVFDFNAPIITPPALFRVDVLTGVDARPATTLTVFPNPVKDLLHVGAPLTTRGVITYDVEDILGRLQLQGTLAPAAEIAVGSLANGVYDLTIHSSGRRQVVRFVKE